MARLPSYRYLIQQAGAQVILFEEGTERQIVKFDPSDGSAAAGALDVIRDSEMSGEDKCYACFWAGYFHAYANRAPEMAREAYVREADEGRAVVVTSPRGRGLEIVRFDPRDASAAARAQKNIYDSGLSPDEKNRAHFWCGFFYGQAS
jgi:hypothetical protein